MDSDELKGISRVINEELLRIRAQSGSGWDGEEAKRVVEVQFGNMRDMMRVGI